MSEETSPDGHESYLPARMLAASKGECLVIVTIGGVSWFRWQDIEQNG